MSKVCCSSQLKMTSAPHSCSGCQWGRGQYWGAGHPVKKVYIFIENGTLQKPVADISALSAVNGFINCTKALQLQKLKHV